MQNVGDDNYPPVTIKHETMFMGFVDQNIV